MLTSGHLVDIKFFIPTQFVHVLFFNNVITPTFSGHKVYHSQLAHVCIIFFNNVIALTFGEHKVNHSQTVLASVIVQQSYTSVIH